MGILFFLICHVLPILLFYICRKNYHKKNNIIALQWMVMNSSKNNHKLTQLKLHVTWLFYFLSQGFSSFDFSVFNSVLVNNVSCKRKSSNLYVNPHYTIKHIICNSFIDFQLSWLKYIVIKLLNTTITQ